MFVLNRVYRVFRYDRFTQYYKANQLALNTYQLYTKYSKSYYFNKINLKTRIAWRFNTVSDYDLIPFGYDPQKKTLMDVHDVQRGKACNCICCACKTPLIARQGDINTWHFAHLSRKVYDQTKTKCEFSVFVSVRMMARQILETLTSINLPEFYNTERIYDPSTEEEYSNTSLVTNSKEVTIQEIKLEAMFDKVPIDASLKTSDGNLLIYFIHPNRVIPTELRNPQNTESTLIIDLESTPILFGMSEAKANQKANNYKSILHDLLKTKLEAKCWISHKLTSKMVLKQRIAINKEIESHRKKLKEMPHDLKLEHRPTIFEESFELEPKEETVVRWVCRKCSNEWEAPKTNKKCPQCAEHIFSTEIT